MDDPPSEITRVVHLLTQGSPAQQDVAITQFFSPSASFTHPFCRTGSFEGSRELIRSIFQWYKILSPTIELEVNSIAYDPDNLLLYVNISQVFAIWFIPFHRSPVNLTTQLQLVRQPGGRKYLIQGQNDLYQTDQFVKFFAPWGIGMTIVMLWQFCATFFCVLGAKIGHPVTSLSQQRFLKRQQQAERPANGITGPEVHNEEMRKGYVDARQVKQMMSVGEGEKVANGPS